jgi:hypothetical protein
MMERYRERLELTDDTEWKAVQPLIQKVLDERTALGQDVVLLAREPDLALIGILPIKASGGLPGRTPLLRNCKKQSTQKPRALK